MTSGGDRLQGGAGGSSGSSGSAANLTSRRPPPLSNATLAEDGPRPRLSHRLSKTDLGGAATRRRTGGKRTPSRALIRHQQLTTRTLVFISRLLLGSSLIVFTLVNTTGATSLASSSAAGQGLSPSDRVHIVRKPANSASSTYKQTKQNFKENFDKIVIHVKENTPIGTRLTEVQPRDSNDASGGHAPASGPQLSAAGSSSVDDKTIYAIVGGADLHAFTLRKDSSEGKVELVNEVNFDYESAKTSYSVVIRATSVYFRYELEVDVVVEDENDNDPQLEDFTIVFNNYKNHLPTGPIGRVPATDRDVNDVLRYRVLNGNTAQLILVNETNGDIQLSPWLNSNVPLRAVMDIGVDDGANSAKAKLVLIVNLITEPMLHNSVVLRLDGITRDEFLSRKFDTFQSQMARILGTSSLYVANNIVVFDVEQSHHQRSPAAPPPPDRQQAANSSLLLAPASQNGAPAALEYFNYKTAYNQHSTVINASLIYVNVSFSARADGNDVEAYLSRQYIEERIFLNRLHLAQQLGAQLAPFQDDICLQEPCQNYQECQLTYKFDKAPKTFYTNRNMIFRQIKTTQSYACLCPATFTGMKNKHECNLQINHCFTNPCLNGGLCHRHESGYTCECRPGEFFGPRCEHNFYNSTCQSIAAHASDQQQQQLQQNAALPAGHGSLGHSGLASASSMCSGKSRCVNLNKSHQHYYQKLAPASPSLAISSASSGLIGSFSCSSCPHPEQWTTSLCQLRARSFDRQSYIVLPSLRRRHRFHLMLQFATAQTDALLLYNGRYNDKHDFIALEVVDSRLRFSFSLGQPGQVFAVSLATVPVSDGQWHKVAVDYRDRNVTLVVDDCDPVLDEALARLQPAGIPARRCANTTTGSPSSSDPAYQMLDLTSPMQIGALAPNLLDSPGDPNGAPETRATLEPQLASLANNFVGCLSDLYVDHQLVDLGTPLHDYGTQAGCPSTPERRPVCQQQTCAGQGATCVESFGQAKCQCGDDRLGKSCELYLSQERVRKFSGNSYLAFNPVEAQIPANWRVSLHFRTLNPSGILFKIFLDSEASILLEVMGGGLKLSHRSSSMHLNKLALDDGEWHFVELSWSGGVGGGELGAAATASLQVDHNPNLSVQSSDMGQVSGATIRYVVVGSSTTRNSASSSSSQFLGSSSLGAPQPQQQPAVAAGSGEPAAAPAPALAPDSLSAAEFAGASTQTPPQAGAGPPADDYAYIYANSGPANNSSSQSFVGCVFGLNLSASDNSDWWQSPYDERNVERGCPVVDPCETGQCPANSRCVRRGLNQRKCLCNSGFVGDLCLPVCELNPCQGEHSRCTPASAADQQRNGSASNSNSGPLEASYPDAASGPQQQQQTSTSGQLYTCDCEPNRSGKNCEHQLSPRCPSNWWGHPLTPGQNASICGPCKCDESKGFDGDCDKLTGQCFCKPNYFQSPDSDYCLACDCYLVGSLSTSCNQTSGQCKCRAGVVGRRCDTCASPYAEVTLRGCEVIYDACPKTYSDGIWWDKTQPGMWASQQCPVSTSTGTATRLCHQSEGWQPANLFNCISNTFTDLYTQYQFLENSSQADSKFQMSTKLTMKIASQLRQALNETISSPAMQLYGSDMYISFRLIHHLIQYETSCGLNLTHRQNRAYVRNIVESVSYILDPNYADNWLEVAKRSPNGGAEYLLKLLDAYAKVLIDSQSDTFTQPFEVATRHLTFGMDAISIDQLYDLTKWTLGSGLSAPPGAASSPSLEGPAPGAPSASLPSNAFASHFPSSPPYATDPFDGSPFGPVGGSSRHAGAASAGEASTSGHFNQDGTSIYLDFESTRDSSPSVVVPKNDNYQAANSDQQLARVFIPLRTLRMRTPREATGQPTGGSAWAARSRAKRDELLIPDYASMRNQRQPLVVYSIFKTLGPLLPRDSDSTVQNRLGMQAQVSSPVVWLTVRPQNSTDFLQRSLQPKVTYMLKLVEPMGKMRPQCATWDFSSPSAAGGALQPAAISSSAQAKESALRNSTGGAASLAQQPPLYGLKQTGRFTTRGCELKGVLSNHRLRYKYEYVNCSCDHLGAVTVLMDNAPGQRDYLASDYDDDADAGQSRDFWLVAALGLSLATLAASLFVLSCVRGHSIKSNSNSINKNLLAVLLALELLILYSAISRGSLNQQDYQCKLVAIFLHYFSISLFFWLFVNAVHFYRMLTELRDINHGPMKFYHVLGYAVPAFFVSIAVGLRIEQFGNYLFCWLSIHEPIIWSMFGPISLVSMLTIILFKLALCKSLPMNKLVGSSAQDVDPNGLDLIKTHMLINIIKTPLISLYWLTAVYAVNESLGEYAFVFPLAIVLKSLVLFALLCIVDKYIRYNLYVSWLKFKGEKVPFVDDSMTQGPYGLAGSLQGGGGGPQPACQGSQQWMFSMVNSMQLKDGSGQLAAPYGPFDMKNQAGQLLFPNQNPHQLQAGGFQSSCTDIFRPELLDGLSAASTTSRSSATGTSSSVAYREYKAARHAHHHHAHHHAHHHKRAPYDELEPDADELDDGAYGRSRRTAHRRHAGGKSKSHRKHHNHSSRHHHSHHHSHHHHKHKSHHNQDDYELGGSREHQPDEDYGHHSSRHHHHRERRAHRSGGGGHHSSRQHHQSHEDAPHRQRAADDSGQHDSLDNILNNDQLLASSHSSDQDDVSTPRSGQARYSKTLIYSQQDRGEKPQQEDSSEASREQRQPLELNAQKAVTLDQTMPMELLASPTQSTSGQPQQDPGQAKDNQPAEAQQS